VAGGIPPTVERLILRCLAPDPADRPASAAEVLAGLPGGDPLAAALAAGETPSPRLVAAAGGAGHLGPRAAVAVLVAALGTTLMAAALNDRAALFRQVPQDLSPRELDLRARKATQQLGYADPPADRARAIATNDELVQLLSERDRGSGRWAGIDRGWPAVMYFWHRQGPDLLTQRLTPADATGWSMPGRVTPRDPPLREPGETIAFLDLAGRLIEFHAVPPSSLPEEAAAPADWDRLFAAADLDPGQFRRVPPARVPPVFADQTAAWSGAHPDRPDLPVRIEAAAFRGRPVYFHVGPEGTQDRVQVEAGPATLADLVQDIQYGLLGLAGVTVGAWLAWRNRRDGRADRPGAFRLATAFAAVTMLGWALTAKHVPDPSDELAMFAGMAGRVLWDAVALWLAYLALEPFVRRRTPQQMIGWNRLLQGRWNDPRVGRDVLLGVLIGAVGEGLAVALYALLPATGYPVEWRLTWDAALTEGAGTLFTLAGYALLTGVRDFFLFVLVRLVCRRDWIAAILAVVLLSAPSFVGADRPYVKGLSMLVFYSLAFVLLLRFGFLAYLVANLAGNLFGSMPIALDVSAWYAIPSTMSLLVLMGLSVAGYVIATRGRETG
jgi:serine/threonine-protein kinase